MKLYSLHVSKKTRIFHMFKGSLHCDAPYRGHPTKVFYKLSANQDV